MSYDNSGHGKVFGTLLFLACVGFSLWAKLERAQRSAKGQGETQVVESASQRKMREEYNLAATIHNDAVKHLRAGRYQEAIDGFTRSLSIRPQSPESLVHRGIAYRALEMWAEALADFERATPSQAADVSELASLRGDCQFFLGRANEAVETYTKGLENAPDNLRLLLDRAQVRGQLGDVEGALSDFDACVSHGVDLFNAKLIAEAYYSRGVLHAAHGEIAKGRADIDKAAEMGFKPRQEKE